MARTVIDIDEEVLARALRLSLLRKKVDVVNYALRRLVAQQEVEQILSLKGKIQWEGDLERANR